MMRSKAQPSSAVASIATMIASPSTPRLSSTESASSEARIGIKTMVAAYAPTDTKAPWPKLSTSIRPNTSVRPLAMMKIIMPMARPAMVSVIQVGKLPTSGSMASIRSGTSSSGAMSRLAAGSAVSGASTLAGGVCRFTVASY